MKSIAVAAALLAIAPAVQAQWKMERQHDRMSDRDQVSFVLLSRERLPSMGARQPRLVLRCQYPATDLLLDAGAVLATSDANPGFHRIRIRLDKQPPETQVGRVSSDNASVYFPEPRGLVPRLVDAKALLIEVTPFQGESTTIGFNVEGLSKLMPQIEKACAMT